MKRTVLFAMSTLFAVALLSVAEESNEAKVYGKGQFIRFKKCTSNSVFIDGDLFFHSIPEQFKEYKFTLRKVNSPSPVKFTVKEAGIVRLVTAGRTKRKLRNEGWVEITQVRLVQAWGKDGNWAFILEKKLDVGKYSIPSEGTFGIRLLIK